MKKGRLLFKTSVIPQLVYNNQEIVACDSDGQLDAAAVVNIDSNEEDELPLSIVAQQQQQQQLPPPPSGAAPSSSSLITLSPAVIAAAKRAATAAMAGTSSSQQQQYLLPAMTEEAFTAALTAALAVRAKYYINKYGLKLQQYRLCYEENNTRNYWYMLKSNYGSVPIYITAGKKLPNLKERFTSFVNLVKEIVLKHPKHIILGDFNTHITYNNVGESVDIDTQSVSWTKTVPQLFDTFMTNKRFLQKNSFANGWSKLT